VTGASAAQIGQCRLWDFFARQIDWIEDRRPTHGHRVVPGMRTRSSGNAARPRRQIPPQRSQFATKGEIRRESSGGCGRFTPQEFREQRFHHRSRKLSLLSGRIDSGASSIRHESTRSERKTRPSGPMIFVPNGAYSKQRDETEAYGKSLITVACCLCNTSPKRLPQSLWYPWCVQHNWDPYWSSSLFGSYSAVRYGGNAADIATANGAFCANYVLGKVTSADFSCNPDFNIAQLGVVTRWTPVKNLTFSDEVMWTHLDQKFTGSAVLTPTAPKPTAV